MLGGGSIQLARVFGIRIRADVGLFLLLGVIVWWGSDYFGDIFPGDEGKAWLLAGISAALLLLSLVLHELGHAVVAIRNGIPVSGIHLWLFGGLANLEREPESPGLDFRVAAAGPLVSLAFTLACFCAVWLAGGSVATLSADSLELARGGEALAVANILAWIEAVWLAFTLVPAFPLDGGRIGRAAVWWRTGDRSRATRVAARVGLGFSGLMVLAGIALAVEGAPGSGVWLGVIGLWLGQSARAAERHAVLTGRIEGLRVSDVMHAEPIAIPDGLTLDRAHDDYFQRYDEHPWFPVVDAEHRLVGLVTRETVEGFPEQARPGRTVAGVMAGDPEGGLRVGADDPFELLLGRDELFRLGGVMAVDSDGRLRGMVTADQVYSALGEPAPARS